MLQNPTSVQPGGRLGKIFPRVSLALLLLAPGPVRAAITQTINYQGFLMSRVSNQPLDVPQDMKFAIYDVPSGGAPLVTPESRCDVPVTKGRYDVEIGSTSGGLPASLFTNNASLWLEIQVDPNGDCSGAYEAMTPRIRLQASPYAFNSLYASTAAAGATVFAVDTLAAHAATTNGGITISTNLYVQGGISVGSISPGQKLSVAGIVESRGAGNGFMFPDGSLQTRAAGTTMWDMNGSDIYSSNAGNVGISTGVPQARFHVYSAPGTAGDLLLLSTGASNMFRVTGEGKVYGAGFYGDGTGLTGVVLKGGDSMTGALTISSLTAVSPLGLSAARLRLAAGVEISSAPPAAYGGVYVSTNLYLPAGAAYYGSGAGLTSLPAVAKTGDLMTGPLKVSGSSLTVVNTSASDPYSLAVTTDPTLALVHLYVSTRGYVGVGTSSPSSRLSVQGDIMSASNVTAQGSVTAASLAAVSGVFSQAVTASSGTFTGVAGYSIVSSSGIMASGTVVAPYFVGNGSLLTGVQGTDSGRVSRTGDVMTGPLAVQSSMSVVSGSGQYYSFTVSSGAAYNLAVTTGGNVGVQISAPSAPLEVYRQIKVSNSVNGSPASLFLDQFNAPGFIRWGDESLSGVSQGALGFPAGTRDLVYRAAAADLATGTEVFRIKSDSSGNWLFGINAPAPAASLHINATTLFGASAAAPLLFVSTASAGVGISTSVITNKLSVAGGIMATSSITARGGFYGDQAGLLTLGAPTSYVSGLLGVGTQTPGARFAVSEAGNETYTMVVGTNPNETINYDMVVTTTGRVGIGTQFPSSPLHVVGSLQVGSDGSNLSGSAVVRLRPMDGDQASIVFEEVTIRPKAVMGTPNGVDYFVFRSGSDDLTGGLGSVESYRILKNGNIGLGAAAPDRKLDVNGGVVVRSSMVVTGQGLGANDDLLKVAASTFNVKMDGKVGIGTASPALTLDVQGAAVFGGALTRSTFTAEGYWQPRWLTTAQLKALAPGAAKVVVGNSDISDLCVSTGAAAGQWALAGSKGANSCW